MDLKEHVVSADGVIIELTAKEYAILEYMMRNKNICLSRDQLQSHIWNYDFMGGSNIVDVYVSNLRRKLSQRGVSNLIETVRSVGYKLCDKREGTDERDEARRII